MILCECYGDTLEFFAILFLFNGSISPGLISIISAPLWELLSQTVSLIDENASYPWDLKETNQDWEPLFLPYLFFENFQVELGNWVDKWNWQKNKSKAECRPLNWFILVYLAFAWCPHQCWMLRVEARLVTTLLPGFFQSDIHLKHHLS